MEKDLATNQLQEVLKQLIMFLGDAKKQWDAQNPNAKSWLGFNKGMLIKATSFMLAMTDDLIQFVETMIEAGPEKKAAVLLIMAQLFDYVFKAAIPIWLKPFTPIIKQIVVNIIIGNLIEFIVAKYKAGYWKMEQKNGFSDFSGGVHQ